MKRWKKRYMLAVVGMVMLSMVYLSQKYWVHLQENFVPEYEQVTLTEESDYRTIFLQTGLGRPAVEKLLAEKDFQTILEAQVKFFDYRRDIFCDSLLGWFTREDRIASARAHEFVDLQPGDILLTLSTHSLGWRHGHAALVIDEDTTLESATLGTDSAYGKVECWKHYANYAVLRVKNVTPELQQNVVEYGQEYLCGIPYHLSSGFIGKKAPEVDEPQFGVHCSYLVWYAWNHFGYDLDSDGGRLVTTSDLLHSELLEIVQMYGMDPVTVASVNRGQHASNHVVPCTPMLFAEEIEIR